MSPSLLRLPIVVLALTLAGCSSDSPGDADNGNGRQETAGVRVAEVQMARSDPNGEAVEPTNQFAPNDLITAVVLTHGHGRHLLSAHWAFGPERLPVHQETHEITPNAEAVFRFGITKADGFPAGDYEVEIRLDGQRATARRFRVE